VVRCTSVNDSYGKRYKEDDANSAEEEPALQEEDLVNDQEGL
jgi:hypothetical protein